MFKALASSTVLGAIALLNVSPVAAATVNFDGDLQARCDLTALQDGTVIRSGNVLTSVGATSAQVSADVIGSGFKVKASGNDFSFTRDGNTKSDVAKVSLNGGNMATIVTAGGSAQTVSADVTDGSNTVDVDVEFGTGSNSFQPGVYAAELTLTCSN